MTSQDSIEQNVRLALGDLTLQLIVSRAQIEELKGQLADALAATPPEKAKANGKAKEAAADGQDRRTQ